MAGRRGGAHDPRMSLHIVKISPTAFFADYGCHVRIFEETLALRNAGHRVTIFAYPAGDTPAGMDVRRAPALPGMRDARVGSHWRKLLLDPLLTVTTTLHGALGPVDVVHAHLHEGALIGWPLARMKGAPLVFDYQGSLRAEMLDHRFLAPNHPALRVFGWLEHLANRAADRILTSSENARTQLLASMPSLDPRHVVTVPDGVDVRRFRPRLDSDAERLRELRRRWRIPEDRLVVGYLGLLAEYQGTGDLIRAAERVLREFSGAHFLVMGFPNEAAYRKAAADAGLESFFTFTGRMAYDEAPAMLRLVDVAVSPKRSETEGNGKLLNYMATGLPTVAYDGAVAAEIMGPDALLAPLGSVDALAGSLLRLLRDAELRRSYGQRLRKRAVGRFAWSGVIGPVLRLYEDLQSKN